MGLLAPSETPPTRTRAVVLVVLAVILIGGVLMFSGEKDEIIVVTFPSGTAIEAEVADTPEKLLFGLAFRESLPPGTGMLYIFETSDRHKVRTKGFLIPVDVIWANESRHVVHLVERAEPCPADPCPAYGPPPENARYVIETEAGFIKREKLSTGAELKFALKL
jgi:uncharacterized membrane protein (UPF0127 family)